VSVGHRLAPRPVGLCHPVGTTAGTARRQIRLIIIPIPGQCQLRLSFTPRSASCISCDDSILLAMVVALSSRNKRWGVHRQMPNDQLIPIRITNLFSPVQIRQLKLSIFIGSCCCLNSLKENRVPPRQRDTRHCTRVDCDLWCQS
jgi:hypothetical protein